MPAKILVASFVETDGLLRAVRKARSQMFRVYDVFAPFPVHGLDEAMGIRRTRLPYVTLLAGLTGLATALTLQFYTNVLDWPLDVGGKPDSVKTLLAFVPISFELTVLFAGLGTVAALLLAPGSTPASRSGCRTRASPTTPSRSCCASRPTTKPTAAHSRSSRSAAPPA